MMQGSLTSSFVDQVDYLVADNKLNVGYQLVEYNLEMEDRPQRVGAGLEKIYACHDRL